MDDYSKTYPRLDFQKLISKAFEKSHLPYLPKLFCRAIIAHDAIDASLERQLWQIQLHKVNFDSGGGNFNQPLFFSGRIIFELKCTFVYEDEIPVITEIGILAK